MKKENLFKGKALSNGKWIEGQRHTYGDGVFICQTELMNNGGKDWRVPGVEAIPETVGEFTGAVDKNGISIFEGDIDKTGLVVGWNQLHFCFGLFDKHAGFRKELLCSQWKTETEMYHRWTDDSIEIVGNVHDAPTDYK